MAARISYHKIALWSALAWIAAAQAAAAAVPAFPEAAGFGAGATGGRGGPVVHVTNLQDRGTGSLRWALEQRGPRIVVFDVGGLITLSDEITIKGDVTVMGQTAPGDGITVSGARLSVSESNVILRGLHLRPGRDKGGQDRDERDGLSVGSETTVVSDVIIDHNSISWATDENMASWYEVRDITFSNNILAEGLLKAGHSEGRHSMGLLVGKTTHNVSVLRNLFISNFWRNPQVEQTSATEIINNAMINYGPGGILVSQGPSRVDIIGNVLVAGRDTPSVADRPAIELKADNAGSAYYLHDNRTPLGIDVAHGAGLGLVATSRIVQGNRLLPILPSGEVLRAVTATAGARAQGLDPVDTRLIARALDGKAKVVSKAWQGTDWRPATATRAREGDRDGDAIPDAAEAQTGTDPALADSHLLDPKTGYAFIEIYANALVSRGAP